MEKRKIYIDRWEFRSEDLLELTEKYDVIEFKVTDKITTKQLVEGAYSGKN